MTAVPGGPVPPGSVVAVVVTRHRSAQLVDSLAAMAKQTHPIAHLVVVDNGPDEPARQVVEEYPLSTVLAVFGLGLGVGACVGMAIFSSSSSYSSSSNWLPSMSSSGSSWFPSMSSSGSSSWFPSMSSHGSSWLPSGSSSNWTDNLMKSAKSACGY